MIILHFFTCNLKSFDRDYNPAIVNQVTDSFSTTLTACKAFYSDQNIPWTLVLPEYLYDPTLEPLLQHHGLKLTGKGVAMAIDINDIDFPLTDPTLIIQSMTGYARHFVLR